MLYLIRWKWVSVQLITHLFVIVVLLLSAYAIYLAAENISYTTNTQSFSEAIATGWSGLWLFIQSFQVISLYNGRDQSMTLDSSSYCSS